jgi:hypothetical protein
MGRREGPHSNKLGWSLDHGIMEPITSYQMMIKHWGKILSNLSTHCSRKITKGDTVGYYVWIPEILP